MPRCEGVGWRHPITGDCRHQSQRTVEEIKEDIERIVNLDPRVTLENTILYINDQSIRAEVIVKYYNIDQAETLFLEYSKRNAEEF